MPTKLALRPRPPSDLRSDILIVILRELLRARPDFRLILMSATLDSALFAQYFDGAPVRLPLGCVGEFKF